jgi:diguanylate cyclase (GGDEF)-like protein
MSESTREEKIKISKYPAHQNKVDEINKAIIDPDSKTDTKTRVKINNLARKIVAKELLLERAWVKNEATEKERDTYKEGLTTDKLTQLPNYNWFKEELTISLNRASRAESTKTQERTGDKEDEKGFFLVTFDIDNFKSINDNFGHPRGDDALRLIAKLERRANEPIVRTGGDEFSQIVNGTMTEKDLCKLISRYQNNFAKLATEAGFPPLTLSFGIARYRYGFDENSWREAADKALYVGKKAGKSKTFIYDETIAGDTKARELIITT